MKYLLDTHTLIWYFENNSRLSANALQAIEQLNFPCSFSIVSLWEMAIKVSIGKLNIQSTLLEFRQKMSAFDIELLPLTFEHTLAVSMLPFHHTDPFDRLLIAQCQVEELILISKDVQFQSYNVEMLW